MKRKVRNKNNKEKRVFTKSPTANIITAKKAIKTFVQRLSLAVLLRIDYFFSFHFHIFFFTLVAKLKDEHRKIIQHNYSLRLNLLKKKTSPQ